MELDLRQAIYQNIASNDQSELENVIIDAIENGEEKLLPGLGVLFELIWKEAKTDEKDKMIHTLEQSLKQVSTD